MAPDRLAPSTWCMVRSQATGDLSRPYMHEKRTSGVAFLMRPDRCGRSAKRAMARPGRSPMR
jgi:hypothetical protein